MVGWMVSTHIGEVGIIIGDVGMIFVGMGIG